jgi:ABC-type nitrate/sulfonate/bicarbonate transport system substrate-binding protein
MISMSRRSAIVGSLGLTTLATLGRPYIANAAAKSAVVWMNQGFVPEEDAAFVAVAEGYMKASGNKLDYSIMPFMTWFSWMRQVQSCRRTPGTTNWWT